jgi:hypothetical protein
LISVSLIPLAEVEKKLRSYGCEPLEGKTPLNTANWWKWPWGGPPFTLPNEDGMVDNLAVQQLIADMARLAPPDWEFPAS